MRSPPHSCEKKTQKNKNKKKKKKKKNKVNKVNLFVYLFAPYLISSVFALLWRACPLQTGSCGKFIQDVFILVAALTVM